VLLPALLGFWQMMNAASGYGSRRRFRMTRCFALGIVLTAFSLIAVGFYTLRARANPSSLR